MGKLACADGRETRWKTTGWADLSEGILTELRVLHTLGWVTGGGVEQLRLLLAQGLPKEPFIHEIICQEASDFMKQCFEHEGWVVHEIGIARHIFDLRWYLKALRLALRFRPDLVHGAVFEGSALATAIGFFLPRATTIIEEQSDGRDRSRRATFLMRTMSILTDATVGVAPQIVVYLRETVKVSEDKLCLVINGATVESRSASAYEPSKLRQKLSFSQDDVIIGSVSRLHDDHKRISDLLRILPTLVARHQNVKYLVVGDGPDRDFLERLAVDLSLGGNVTFVGHQDDVGKFLSVIDIFALPSAGEALPLALVEAMHAGLPCVTTDVGGNSFAMDGGACGKLVPPGKPDSFRKALEELISSPESRREYGILARARASSLFAPEAYVESVQELWRSKLRTR